MRHRSLLPRDLFAEKELNTEQVAAEFDNGVLKPRIPKAAHSQPRKIEMCVERIL